MAVPSSPRVVVAALVIYATIGQTTAASGASPGFDERHTNSLPQPRRHPSSKLSNVLQQQQQKSSSNLVLSKVFFFAGQPAISALLASRDHHRFRRQCRQLANNDALVASSQTENGLQLRGGVSAGGTVPPILELARDLASVSAAALFGLAITLGERFFGMFGREVPPIIRRIHHYDRRSSGSSGAATAVSDSIFGSTSAGRGSISAVGIPALSRFAIAFAVASTLVGTGLVSAATAALAVNTEDAITFAILDGLGVFITYLGVLVCRGQLEWIEIVAARGVLPWGILLGLLGFLGIYA
mmetsp:Transcript_8087/g.17486  ORF Transcript_8087/g.17486 Transcript_8087/m.17486 type:complete len:299 (-) Transcript_8087:2438-3334(-)